MGSHLKERLIIEVKTGKTILLVEVEGRYFLKKVAVFPNLFIFALTKTIQDVHLSHFIR